MKLLASLRNSRDDGSTQWWTILYTGRDAGKDEDGSFVWKLRDELSTALDKVDLSGIELYVGQRPPESRIMVTGG